MKKLIYTTIALGALTACATTPDLSGQNAYNEIIALGAQAQATPATLTSAGTVDCDAIQAELVQVDLALNPVKPKVGVLRRLGNVTRDVGGAVAGGVLATKVPGVAAGVGAIQGARDFYEWQDPNNKIKTQIAAGQRKAELMRTGVSAGCDVL